MSDEEIADEKSKVIEARSKMNEGYYRLIEALKDYISTTEENYKVIALWIIGTYYHEQFNSYPYLFFNAMRGSGKTRTLRLISALARGGDGSVQNNLTEAVLFRIPRNTTTCIDEIEQIGSKEKQTLRELLNSAYKKGMKVKRMRKSHDREGEKQVVEVFQPYFPICMANIWGMDEVLGDRSITLVLEKSDDPRVIFKVEDFENNYTILDLKRTFEAFSVVSVMYLLEKNYIRNWNSYINSRHPCTNNYINTLYTQTTLTTQNTSIMTMSDYGIPEYKKMEIDEFFNKIYDLKITGRNFELAFPLILTAQLLGDEVLKDFLTIVSQIFANKSDEEYLNSKDIAVYDFVSSRTESNQFLSVKELVSEFRLFIGESDDDDRWLNDKWFGRALKRLNLVLEKKRWSSGQFVILNHNKAKDKMKIFKSPEDKK